MALSITFSSCANDRDSHKTPFSSILSYIKTTKKTHPHPFFFFFSIRSSCPQTHDIQYAEQSFRRAGAEGSHHLPDSHLSPSLRTPRGGLTERPCTSFMPDDRLPSTRGRSVLARCSVSPWSVAHGGSSGTHRQWPLQERVPCIPGPPT